MESTKEPAAADLPNVLETVLTTTFLAHGTGLTTADGAEPLYGSMLVREAVEDYSVDGFAVSSFDSATFWHVSVLSMVIDAVVFEEPPGSHASAFSVTTREHSRRALAMLGRKDPKAAASYPPRPDPSQPIADLLREHARVVALPVDEVLDIAAGAISEVLVGKLWTGLEQWAADLGLSSDVAWLWLVEPDLFGDDMGLCAVLHPGSSEAVYWRLMLPERLASIPARPVELTARRRARVVPKKRISQQEWDSELADEADAEDDDRLGSDGDFEEWVPPEIGDPVSYVGAAGSGIGDLPTAEGYDPFRALIEGTELVVGTGPDPEGGTPMLGAEPLPAAQAQTLIDELVAISLRTVLHEEVLDAGGNLSVSAAMALLAEPYNPERETWFASTAPRWEWQDEGITRGQATERLLADHLNAVPLTFADLARLTPVPGEPAQAVATARETVIAALTTWADVRSLDPNAAWLWAIDDDLFSDDFGLRVVFHPDSAEPVYWRPRNPDTPVGSQPWSAPKSQIFGAIVGILDRADDLIESRAAVGVHTVQTTKQARRDAVRLHDDVMSPADRDRWHFSRAADRMAFIAEQLAGASEVHRANVYQVLRDIISDAPAGTARDLRYATAGRKLLADGLTKKEAAAALGLKQAKLTNLLREQPGDVVIGPDDNLRTIVGPDWEQPAGLPDPHELAGAESDRQQTVWRKQTDSHELTRMWASEIHAKMSLRDQEQLVLNGDEHAIILRYEPDLDPDLIDMVRASLIALIRDRRDQILQRYGVAARALKDKGANQDRGSSHLGISKGYYRAAFNSDPVDLPEGDYLHEVIASFRR